MLTEASNQCGQQTAVTQVDTVCCLSRPDIETVLGICYFLFTGLQNI